MGYTFKSLTPVYTGNAWMRLDDLKPTNIYGGVRFWFDVFCFNEKCDKKIKITVKDELKNKDVELFNGNLSEFLFGKDGWKGVVEVKIDKENKQIDLENYGFAQKTGENNEYYKISLPERKYIDRNGRNKIPSWYIYYKVLDDLQFTLYFSKTFKFFENSSFKINGITKEELKNVIKNFVCFFDKFGFVGGKWELGFGKVGLVDNLECNNFGKEVKNEDDLFNLNANEIRYFEKLNNIGKGFNENNLKEYLKWKLDKRKNFKLGNVTAKTNDNTAERHFIFGSANDGRIYKNGKWKEVNSTNGSKILPVFGKNEFYIISLVFLNKYNEQTTD